MIMLCHCQGSNGWSHNETKGCLLFTVPEAQLYIYSHERPPRSSEIPNLFGKQVDSGFLGQTSFVNTKSNIRRCNPLSTSFDAVMRWTQWFVHCRQELCLTYDHDLVHRKKEICKFGIGILSIWNLRSLTETEPIVHAQHPETPHKCFTQCGRLLLEASNSTKDAMHARVLIMIREVFVDFNS